MSTPNTACVNNNILLLHPARNLFFTSIQAHNAHTITTITTAVGCRPAQPQTPPQELDKQASTVQHSERKHSFSDHRPPIVKMVGFSVPDWDDDSLLSSPEAMDVDGPSYAEAREQSVEPVTPVAVPGAFVFSSPAVTSEVVSWREREAHIKTRAASSTNSGHSPKRLSPAGRAAMRAQQEGDGSLRATKRRHGSAEGHDAAPVGRVIAMGAITLAGWLAKAAWVVTSSLARLIYRRVHGGEAQIVAVTTSSGKRRCVLSTGREVGTAAPNAVQQTIHRAGSLDGLLRVVYKARARSIAAGRSGNQRALKTPINKLRRASNTTSSRASTSPTHQHTLARHRRNKRQPPKKYHIVARPPPLTTIEESQQEDGSPPITSAERERQAWSAHNHRLKARLVGAQAAQVALDRAAEKDAELDNDPTPASPATEELDTPSKQSTSINNLSDIDAAHASQKAPMTATTEPPLLPARDEQTKKPRKSISPTHSIGRWTIAALAASKNDELLKDDRIDLLTKKARALILKNDEEQASRQRLKDDFSRLRQARLSRHQDLLDAAQARVDAKLAENERLRLEALATKERIQKEAAEKKAAEEKKLEEARAKAEAQIRAAEAERARQRVEAEEAERLAAQQIFRHGELIVPPSDAMQAAMDTKMAVRQNAVIATTITNAQLERDDLARVLGTSTGARAPAWLNDVSVNAWMSALCAAMNEKHGWTKTRDAPTAPYAAYSSAWLKQVQDKGAESIKRWTSRLGIKNGRIDETVRTFLPVNTGAHWTLVAIHGKERKVEYLDSLGGNSTGVINLVRSILQSELGANYNASEWSVPRSRSSHQDNSDDCGVFTCFNALASATDTQYREITAAKMPAARRLMTAVLINGGFVGDARLS